MGDALTYEVRKAIYDLERRTDEAAARELVTWFEHVDPEISDAAASALATRELPASLRLGLARSLVEHSRFGDQRYVARRSLELAARALFEGPPAEAFDIAAGLLELGAVADRAYQEVRAEVIVAHIEELLARAYAGDLVAIDPRWRRPCEALAVHAPRDRREMYTDRAALGRFAALAVDGFQFVAGERHTPAVLELDLGEDDEAPFPFAIAGFELDADAGSPHADAAVQALRAGSFPAPPGLHRFRHQYAGASCAQAVWIGYGVLLPPDARAQLAEVAAAVGETHGDRMSVAERMSYGAALARLLPAGIDEGHEALVVGPGPPIAALRGFAVLSPDPGAPWRRSLSLSMPDQIASDGEYGDAHEHTLERLGAQLGAGAPRIALLWGNSD